MTIHEPIINILERDPLFENPVTPHHQSVELRQVWAIRLFRQGRFKTALALFDSLKGEVLHGTITYLMKQCRELVSLAEGETAEERAKLAYTKIVAGFGKEGMKSLQQLWKSNRNSYPVLRYCLQAMAIRRGISIPFLTGESKLYDQVSTKNGRWNCPKQVKTSGLH